MHSAVITPMIDSSGDGSADHFSEIFTATKAESATIFNRKEVPIGEEKQYLQDKVAINLA